MYNVLANKMETRAKRRVSVGLPFIRWTQRTQRDASGLPDAKTKRQKFAHTVLSSTHQSWLKPTLVLTLYPYNVRLKVTWVTDISNLPKLILAFVKQFFCESFFPPTAVAQWLRWNITSFKSRQSGPSKAMSHQVFFYFSFRQVSSHL